MAIVDFEALQRMVVEAGMDALVVGGPDNISHLLNHRNYDNIICQRNFRDQSSALIIPAKGGSIFVTEVAGIFVDATKRLPFMAVENIEADILEMTTKLAAVLRREGLAHATLGIDLDFIPARWMNLLKEELPDAHWVDSGTLLAKLRLPKTEKELVFIGKAIAALEADFLAVGRELRPGRKVEDFHAIMAQGALAAGGSLEYCSAGCLAREWGAPPYPTWFGYEDCTPDDGTFRLDACGSYQFYLSDMMRTFYIGKLDAKTRDQYQVGRNFKKAMVACVRCGMRFAELYAEVKDVAKSHGFTSFHGIHSIGLLVHERPFFFPFKTKLCEDDANIVLPENMVFCAESCWGSPKERRRMGEEDMYVLKKDGPVMLTSLPQALLQRPPA